MKKNYELNYIFRRISSFASYPFHIIYIVFFLSLGYVNEAIKLFLAFILIYLLGFPIRLFFFRERPKKREYENGISKFVASSFPSLHSSRAVYFGIFFSTFFMNLYTTLFFLVITLVTLYSRIYRKKHYLSDVIGGTILGIIIWQITLIIM